MTSTYNARDLKISFGGQPIEGFADGDFFEFEKESDDYSDRAGTDGSVTRSRMNDPRATATLTTEQSSLANDQLNAVRQTGLATGLQVAFEALDLNGATVLAGLAWVQKPAPASYAREAGTRVWPIRMETLAENYGGILT